MPAPRVGAPMGESRRRLHVHEDSLLRGYLGPDGVPRRTVQLLVLLDKWSDHVSERSRGGGSSRRTARAMMKRAGERHYRREAARLVGVLEVPDTPSGARPPPR